MISQDKLLAEADPGYQRGGGRKKYFSQILDKLENFPYFCSVFTVILCNSKII
jgi:hypothetical protein